MRVKRTKPIDAEILPVKRETPPDPQVGMDSILSELSSVARAFRDPGRRRRSLNPHRSRFIFTLTGPSDEELRQQELTQAPELPRSSRQVDDRADVYSVELPSQMEDIMVKTREFMLTELAPKAMASMTGIDQAKLVIERVVGGRVDGVTEHFFHQLVIKATNLRLCKFIAELFDLSIDEVQAMLTQVDYTKRLVIERPPIGSPLPEMEAQDEQPRRPKKKSKPVLSRTSGNKPTGSGRRTRSRTGSRGSDDHGEDV